MELLDERWTLLVVRELLMGSRHFNDLRRGVPRMSPALLSKRLHTLTRAGVVERHQTGTRVEYVLTEAGRELLPVVEALGQWGTRWVPALGDADLDPQLLLWDMHRNLDVAAMPEGQTVIHLHFTDLRGPSRRWWLVVDGDRVDVCDSDPEHPVALTIESPLPVLVALWRGDLTWSGATRAGLHLDGPDWARRAAPRWLRLSAFATIPRPHEQTAAPGARMTAS